MRHVNAMFSYDHRILGIVYGSMLTELYFDDSLTLISELGMLCNNNNGSYGVLPYCSQIINE